MLLGQTRHFFGKFARGGSRPDPVRMSRRCLRLTAAILGATMILLPLGGLSAHAYQVPVGAWGGTGAVATGALPAAQSGQVSLTATTSGLTSVLNRSFVPSTSYGATAAQFSPGGGAAATAVQFLTGAEGCPATGVCTNRGQVKLTFTRPVKNPILHLAGIGGANSQTTGGVVTASSAIHARATVSSSTPAGITFGSPSAGATNLKSNSTTFETTNSSNNNTCAATSGGGINFAATAGCGSIPVNGTVTELVLDMAIVALPVVASGFAGAVGTGDGWSLTFSADEDFGDAPSSYEAGAPATHMVSDLALGATNDSEQNGTINAGTGTGGLAVAAGADANAPAGDGAQDDAISTPLPSLLTSNIGSTYTVPVDLSGSSSAGMVCGWVDFDRGGTFNAGASAERACANFTAGQTTANLSWTVPAATTAGRTYARFRASYNTTQAQSPTGQADSGEVEDYTVEIKPAIRVIKDLLPAANPGTFDLSINGTAFATAVGDNGSTGFKSVDDATTSGPTDITVGQNVQTTAIPMTVSEQAAAGTNLGQYAASVACRNAAGTLLSSAGAVNIPASVTGAGANGQAQTITCTFTNRSNLVLADDAASTLEDTNIVIDVLDNDLGSGGDPMVNSSVKIAAAAAGPFGSLVTIAGQGTYTVNPTSGEVTFDPIPGFTGVATPIFYEAGDGIQTGQAQIRVTVTPRPPLAVPDTATTPQSIGITKNVLTNDVPGSLALDPASLALLNPATGTYGSSVTIPGEGSYAADNTGVVTFTPVNSFRGVATPITYRVANTSGTTSPSTLTITVTPVNPDAVNDSATTPSDTNITLNLATNDVPGLPAVPLVPNSVRLFDIVSGSFGASVTVAAQGTYTVDTATGLVTFDPVASFTGVATPVSYRIADANGSTDTASLTITVKGRPIANPDTATTPQNVDVTVNPTANDTSGVGGGAPIDPTTLQLLDPANNTYTSSVTIAGQGTYAVNPVTGAVTFNPVPTFTGFATPLSYRVGDAEGVLASSTITIRVLAITPIAVNDVVSTPRDTTVTISVPANDSPGGPSAPLVPGSVQLLDPITSTYGATVSIPGEGTYTVDPTTGVVTFDPLPNFAGDATGVTYQISDANGTAQTALILVTVKGPPRANPDTATTAQNVNVTLTPIANDTLGDFGGPPFNPTSVQLLDPATNTYGTTLTVAGQGTYTVNTVSGKVIFDPLPTFTGVASPVTYQVRDGDGIPASSTLTVTVAAINPTAVNDAARTPADINVVVNPLSNDTSGAVTAPLDPASVKLQDPADNVFKSSITVAGQGTYTVDPITGQVTFDPIAGFSGAATPVTYQVADTNGSAALATISITVEEPPVANPDNRTTDQNVTISLNPLANDAPGATANTPLDPTRVRLLDPADSVYKASVTIPGEGAYTANTTTGEVTFDPVSVFAGVATPVRYQIRDLDGARASSTITITVAALVPTAVDDAATTSDDADISVPLLDNDTPGAPSAPLDPASVKLKDPVDGAFKTTVTVTGEGVYTVDSASGSVSFDPEPGFLGAATALTYQVADTNGSSDTAVLRITVVPNPPVANPDSGNTIQGVPVTVDPLTNDLQGSFPVDQSTVQLKDPATGAFSTSVTVTGVGTYTADPVTGEVTFSPEPSFSGNANPIEYRVADTDGNTAESTMEFTVLGIDPTAVDNTATTPHDTNAIVDVLANDSAGDPQLPLDPASVRVKDPADSTFKTSVTIPGEGTFTVNSATGEITFDPLPSFAGTSTVAYRVADKNGTTASAQLSVTTKGAPVANADDTATTPQNVTITIDPLSNDLPGILGGAPLDPSSLELRDPDTGAFGPTLTIPGEGKYTVDPATGKVTFDPEPQFVGTATPIAYRVLDEDGIAASSTMTITVTPITPNAADDSAVTPSDVPVTVEVLGNDTAGAASAPLDQASVQLKDPADGALKSSVTIPGEGRYTVDPVSGEVTFDPLPTFAGSSTVTYRVLDGNGTAATAELTVRVKEAPTANADDSIVTPQNITVTVEPLANDTPGEVPFDLGTMTLIDPSDGSAKLVVDVPGEGSYTLNPATAVVSFDPLPTFTGVAKPITYRVLDTDGVLASSTIKVTVTPINPTAVADTRATPANTTITVAVLANDSEGAASAPLDPASVTVKNPTTGIFGSTLVIPGEGSYAVNSAGEVTFDPEPSFAGVATPITYQVSDTNGTAATAVLAITVKGAPVANDDDTATTPQNVTITVDVLSNDDPGTFGGAPLDSSTVKLLDPADNAYKTSVTTPEGTFTVDPATGAVTFDPAPGYVGTTPKLTYQVLDEDGIAATGGLIIEVTPINPDARDDTGTTQAGDPVTVAVLANDSEGAASAPLDPTAVQLLDPADSTFKTGVTIAGQGSYTVDPADGAVTFTPVAGYSGVATAVTYRIADSNGTTDTAKLTITVIPDAPIAQPDTETTEQGVAVTVEVLANDDPGTLPLDLGSVRLLDPSDNSYTTSVSIADQGAYIADSATGKVTFTPVPSFTGTADPVTYRVANSEGTTASSTLTVTVTAVTPSATDDARTTPSDVTITVAVLDNDSAGAPSAPLQAGSVAVKDPADGAFKKTVTVAGQGSFTVNANGTVEFNPEAGFAGVATVDYRVADKNGTLATAELAITVKQAPQADPDVAVTTPQNVTISFDPLANDVPGGAPLDLSTLVLRDPATGTFGPSVTIPGEGGYAVDPATGTVTFDPEPLFRGPATELDYRVLDQDGVPALSIIKVTVTPIDPNAINDARTTPSDVTLTVPVLDNDLPGAASAPLDPATVLLEDPDTASVMTSVSIAGEGKYSVNPDGSITFDPEPGFAGVSTVSYQISDANGTTDTAKLAITVKAAPGAVPDATPQTPQNITVDFDPLANDVPGGAPFDPSTLVLKDPADGSFKKTVSIPGEGTFTVNPDGSVTFDPLPTFTGVTQTLPYRVLDQDNVPASSTIRVTVTPINPLVLDDAIATDVDTTVTIPVTANDAPGAASAPLDLSTLKLRDPADGLFKPSLTIPGEGDYTVNLATGEVTFDPDPAFFGPATPITYQISDSNGTAGTATLTVTVTPDSPTASPDVDSTDQGVPVIVPVLANDLAGSVPLDTTSVQVKDPTTGTFITDLTVPGEGRYVVDPATGEVTFTPVKSFTADTTTVTYQVADTSGLKTESSIDIAVQQVIPEAFPEIITTPSDVTVTVDVLANDQPGAATAPLDSTTVLLQDPADNQFKPSITVPGVGSYSVNPSTGAVTFDPLPTTVGSTPPVTYRVLDANGTSALSALGVIVKEAPAANPDDTAVTPQNVTVVVEPLLNDVPGGAPFDQGSLELRDPVTGNYVQSVVIPGQGEFRVEYIPGNPVAVVFDPLPTFTGTTDPVTYRVRDLDGVPAQSVIEVLVTPITPQLTDDVATTPSDVTITVPVLANDAPGAASAPLEPSSLTLIDPTDGLAKDSVSIPAKGTFTVNPDGTVSFDPLPTFAGAASIDYQLADSNGTAERATLTVTTKVAPKAVPDTDPSTPQNVPVEFDPLGNDVPGGAPFDPPTLAFTPPGGGTPTSTVTIPNVGRFDIPTPGGPVTFTPVPTFVGVTPPLEYCVRDLDGVRACANITVTVTPITPDAAPDSVVTPSDRTVDIPVLGNDTPGAPSAPLDPSTVALRDPATGTYEASVTLPGAGTFTVNPTTGVVTFDPEPTFAGTATVTYRIADGNGTTDTATVAVQVKKAPVAVPDTDPTTPQGVPVPFDPTKNDLPGEVPFVPPTLTIYPPGSDTPGGPVTIPGVGTFEGPVPDGPVIFTPVPPFVGVTPPVKYCIEDADGVQTCSTFTVTVTPISPIARDDAATTPAVTPLTVEVLANDSAGAATAPLNVTSVQLLDPADNTYKASVDLPGIATFTVDPATGEVRVVPDPAFGGLAAVQYRVADQNGTFASAVLEVQIDGVPEALPDAIATRQNVTVTVDPLANDIAQWSTLTPDSVQLLDPVSNSYGSALTIAGEGTYTVDPATGEVTFDPVASFTGAATPVTYRVLDSNQISATSTITVTVADVEPVAAADAVSTGQNLNVTLNPLANDSAGDPAAPLDDTTVRLLDPADGTYQPQITIADQGSYTVAANGQVTFDPVPSFTGAATPVTYRVADTNGTLASSTITVTVLPIRPTLENDSWTTPYDITATRNPLANDQPGDPSAPLDPTTVALVDAAGNPTQSVTVVGEGVYTVELPAGEITFNPEAGFVGPATAVTYEVADLNGSTSRALLDFTVLAQPDAVGDSPVTKQNVTKIFDPLDNDVPNGAPFDKSTLLLQDPVDGSFKATITVLGEGSYTVDPATGTVSFDPEPSFVGQASPVTYQVTDGNGVPVTGVITAVVTPVTPIAALDFEATPNGVPVTVEVLANDRPGDPSAPLDPSSVQLWDPATSTYGKSLDTPEGQFLVNANGTVTFEPLPGSATIPAPVTYRVLDANGTVATAELTIILGNPPLANPDVVSTKQNVTVTIEPLANDEPGLPTAPLVPTSLLLEDPATGMMDTEVSVVGQGDYSVNPDGTVDFDPAPEFTGGTTPVTYLVLDRNQVPAESTITVGVDETLPAGVEDTASTEQGIAVTVAVLTNDITAAGVPIDKQSVRLVDPSSGRLVRSLSIEDEGAYEVTPDGAVTFTPEALFASAATPMTYAAKDAQSRKLSASVRVDVRASGLAKNDRAVTDQGVPVAVSVLANDLPRAGVPLVKSSVRLLSPSGALVSRLVVGKLTYQVEVGTGRVIATPAAGYVGTADPVRYLVRDKDGRAGSAVLTVEVRPLDAPAAPPLARTGGIAALVGLGGLGLLGVGAALVLITRRRRGSVAAR